MLRSHREEHPMTKKETTAPGTIVVCEPRAFWTPALQRELQPERHQVRGCHSLRELNAILMNDGKTIVVYDLSFQPEGCLTWLAGQHNGAVPTIVLGSKATAELEPVFREWGARSFVVDLISRTDLAALCRRWLRYLIRE